MSFVQRLRMANMFPVRSDLGNARIEDDGNEMNEVIEIGKRLALFNRDILNNPNNQPRPISGIRAVGDMGFSKPRGMANIHPSLPANNFGDEPMNTQVNWNSLDTSPALSRVRPTPVNNEQQEVGMSNDNKLFVQRVLDDDIDSQLNRRVKEQQIAKSQADIDSKGWKTVNVTDPNNPGQTIAIRANDITGETKPLDLPGQITNKENPAAIQKRLDDTNKASSNKKAYLDKTNESLSVIKDLMDDAGNLTTEGARAVGKSSIGNWIPTTKGYSGGLKINKLRNEQVLNLIKELKEQSKTGATGMGNMSNKDLSVINNAATLLDSGLDEEEFKKQLAIVKSELNDIVQRLSSDDSVIKPTITNSSTNPPKAPKGFEYVRRPDNKGWTAVKKVGK